MNSNTIYNMVVQVKKKLNDDTTLCFGAAAGCFVVGALGWLVNWVQPDTTLLHGLLVVAGFYCFLGVVSLLKSASTSDAAKEGGGSVSVNSTGAHGDKTFKSAA